MIRHRIALATSEKLADLHDDDLRLTAPLARAKIACDPAVWTDPTVDWRSFDAVVIRSVWDYFERFAEFKAWLLRLSEEGVRVFNPVPTILANGDKVYLRELAAAGAQVLPTRWIDRGSSSERVAEVLASLRWDEVVIKPSISAGAFRTARLKKNDLASMHALAATIAEDAHVMIQPFMPEVLAAGEWSFMFFGEEFSHAVVKLPKPGDFRVQFTHGGRHRQADPAADILKQAKAVFDMSRTLTGCSGDRLYTRVDGIVRGVDFLCIEVELIEPYLFLEEDIGAPMRFVAALAGLL